MDNEQPEPKPSRMDRWRGAYPYLAILVSCLALSIVTAVYVTASNNARIRVVEQSAERAQAAADRVDKALHQMCPLFATLDSAYRASPPVTTLGKLVASEMHDVVVKLRCADRAPR